jgi:glucuronokinase
MIIKAVLSALMRFYGLTEKEIPKPVQPNLILEAETEELDISAGPQDRVVAVYGGLVHMDFTEEAYAANGGLHGNYHNLDPSLLPPLFVVYRKELSKSSGKVHNIVRYKAEVEHDKKIIDAMKRKAELVEEARECLLKGNRDALGPIMSRDFELRKSVYDISAQNLKMIEIARQQGAHAKFTGSGGAAIGTYRDSEHFQLIKQRYLEEGFEVIRAAPIEYSPQSL